MFNRMKLKTIMMLSSAFMLTIIVSCQKNERKTRFVGGTNPSQSSDKNNMANGTSDSGGCNGFDNKCSDKFIVDPTQLEAYKTYIQPIFEKFDNEVAQLDSESSRKNKGNIRSKFLSNIAKLKTWYIAPVDLKKINKDVLGFSNIANDSQQIAIQTNQAIWIDKKVFEVMSPQDQANMISHEIVMMMYLLKYRTISEICEQAKAKVDFDAKCSSEDPNIDIDKWLPREEPKSLDANDNEIIRSINFWFMTEGTKLSVKDFYQKLNANKFDKRIFNLNNLQSEADKNKKDESFQNKVELSYGDLFKMIETAKLTNNLPDKCSFLSLDITENCQLSWEYSSSSEVSMVNLNIKDSKNSPIDMFNIINSKLLKTSVYFSSPDQNDYQAAVVFFWPIQHFKNFNIGDKINFFGVVIERNKDTNVMEDIKLRSLIVIKRVVTDIRERENDKDIIFSRINPKNSSDAEIVINTTGKIDAYTQLIVNSPKILNKTTIAKDPLHSQIRSK